MRSFFYSKKEGEALENVESLPYLTVMIDESGALNHVRK